MISAEVEAKLDVVQEANERLKGLLDLKNYDVPLDFDDFGRTKGESSYIAIVHTDGNRMGERIINYLEQHSSTNRSLIAAQRDFSNSIEDTALEVLVKTMQKLIACINEDEKKIAGIIEVKNNKLPFRPIVFGGDDLTFVCEGRLGLSLTAYYLRELSKRKLADNKPAYCRAGVALVKTHFPFARGYALAEELCASAKKRVNELRDLGEEGATALDWHFATAGLLDNLETIRKREFTVQEGMRLNLRPLSLFCDADWRSWTNFEKIVQAFNEEPWIDRRNKIKALREILRTGSGDAVKHFLTAHSLPALPDIPENAGHENSGFQGKYCGYFDAIEALIFMSPWKEVGLMTTHFKNGSESDAAFGRGDGVLAWWMLKCSMMKMVFLFSAGGRSRACWFRNAPISLLPCPQKKQLGAKRLAFIRPARQFVGRQR